MRDSITGATRSQVDAFFERLVGQRFRLIGYSHYRWFLLFTYYDVTVEKLVDQPKPLEINIGPVSQRFPYVATS